MKIIFKISTFLFLLSSVIFIVSCNKQDTAFNTPKTVDVAQMQYKLNNVKFENGMLIFNTKADLDSAFSFTQRNQSDGAKWLHKQFPEYISMDRAFNSLTKEDYEQVGKTGVIPLSFKNFLKFETIDTLKTLQKMIEVLTLSILLNKEGNVAYGDKVMHIDYENSYIINASYFFKNINIDFTKINSPEIIVSKNFHNRSQDLKKATPRNTYVSFSQDSNTPDRRFAVTIDESIYGNFQNVSVRTQYLSWHGWWLFGSWQIDWCLNLAQGGRVFLGNGDSYDVSAGMYNGGAASVYWNSPNLIAGGSPYPYPYQYYSYSITQHHWLTYEWQEVWKDP